jgi:hypothetical protein
MMELKDSYWNLDGEEDFSIWEGAKVIKHQTGKGIAYEMYWNRGWYFSTETRGPTKVGNKNIPYWYSGRFPNHLILTKSFFPKEDPLDDIVSVDD